MKTGLILLAVCCLLSIASSQWLEKTAYLPDSLSGVDAPSCILYNPDGNKIYVGGGNPDGWPTAGTDWWVVVIDGAIDQRIARIPVRSEVRALAYNSTNNKVYALNAADSSITVIDAGPDTVLATVKLGGRSGYAMCWSPDANKVYCGLAGDSLMVVIDGATDGVIATFTTVYSIDRLLCATGFDRVYCTSWDFQLLAVIDTRTDTVIARVDLPNYPSDMCYDSAGGRVFVLQDRGHITVLDAAGDSVVASASIGYLTSLSTCHSLRHNSLYCANEEDSLVVIDASTLSITTRVFVGWEPSRVCYDSMRDRVYCSDAIGDRVTVVDCATNEVSAVVRTGLRPRQLVLNPSNTKVYCLNVGSNDVTVLRGDSAISLVTVGSRPTALCYNPTRNKVYSGDAVNGLVAVLDGATNELRANIRVGYRVGDLCYSTQEDKVYCPVQNDSAIAVIDCAGDTLVARIRVPSRPEHVCYSEVQNKVYCTTMEYNGHSLWVVDCASDSIIATIRTPDKPLAIGYREMEDKVYVGYGDGLYVDVVACSTDSIIATIHGAIADAGIRGSPSYDRVYCGGGPWVYAVDAVEDTVMAVISQQEGIYRDICLNAARDLFYLNFVRFGLPPIVLVVDAATNVVLRQVTPGSSDQLCYNAVNDKVYMTRDSDVRVMECSGDQIVAQIAVGRKPRCMVWNPTQNRVYVASVLSGSISVLRDSGGIGIEESPKPRAGSHRLDPMITRGMLFLPEATGRKPQDADLLDIAGKKVLDLHAGANDVRALAPGVYFYRLDTPGFTDVKKAVLVR